MLESEIDSLIFVCPLPLLHILSPPTLPPHSSSLPQPCRTMFSCPVKSVWGYYRSDVLKALTSFSSHRGTWPTANIVLFSSFRNEAAAHVLRMGLDRPVCVRACLPGHVVLPVLSVVSFPFSPHTFRCYHRCDDSYRPCSSSWMIGMIEEHKIVQQANGAPRGKITPYWAPVSKEPIKCSKMQTTKEHRRD